MVVFLSMIRFSDDNANFINLMSYRIYLLSFNNSVWAFL